MRFNRKALGLPATPLARREAREEVCAGVVHGAAREEGQGATLRYRDCTVVFADIVDSGRLMEADEPAAVRSMRRLFAHVETTLLPRYGAALIEQRGDSVLLACDELQMAVDCGFAMMDIAQQAGFVLRVGMHRASVLTDERLLFGHGVNVAARIAAAAPPGEIQVSESIVTALHASSAYDSEDLGLRLLKNVRDPLRLFRLTRANGEALRSSLPPETLRLQPTVAVLPLRLVDGVTGDVSPRLGVGDVITDLLVGTLSRSAAIHVISRLSSQVFRSRTTDLAQAAAALGADIVVSGDVLQRGETLQLQVQITELPSGRVIGMASSKGPLSAALHHDSPLVAEIAVGISDALFRTAMETAGTTPLPNLRSHTLLIAAINLLYRLSPSDFERARQALDTLNERSPRHPVPLAWLARWHLFRVVQGWSQDRNADGQAAYTYAQRALELDPGSALALTMLGNVHTSYLRQLDAAEALYDRALAINPNEPLAWLQRGNCLSFRGQGSEALAQTQRAVQLSPLDPARHFFQSLLASAALSAGQYARAVHAARTSLKLNADHVSSHRVLTIALALQGDLDQARRAAQRLLAHEPDLTVAAFVARSPGRASGLAQRFGEALRSAGVPAGLPA